jgi:hypothetical protein
MSGVGCSQLRVEYWRDHVSQLCGTQRLCSDTFASGSDSIMWKVYAKRVLSDVLRGDLWRTEPWMITRSPEDIFSKESGRQAGHYLADTPAGCTRLGHAMAPSLAGRSEIPYQSRRRARARSAS